MIVIPMAGLSSRFTEAGYLLPKYMLHAHGKTLFEHSVESFKEYFESEKFLFIALEIHGTEDFIDQKCKKLNIGNFRIVILDEVTRGQAETVYLGLKSIDVAGKEPITIFNIDTFRPNYFYPSEFSVSSIDGYLETFIGSGKNWSNVLPIMRGSNKVKQTAEKQEISQFCCTGLYCWSKSSDFIAAFEETRRMPIEEMDSGEYYIAPMYNMLIKKDGDIRFKIVERTSVIFCGVPDEYEEFKKLSF